MFTGLYFGIPNWQKDAVLPDDAYRKTLRKDLPKFINSKNKVIKKEINLIQEWIESGERDYHTFKIKNSNEFALPK